MSTPEIQEELKSLDTVRRRVLAIIWVVLAAHGVLALWFVAHHLYDQGRVGDAWIMIVMCFVNSIAMSAVTLIILGKKPWAPLWNIICLIPPVIAAVTMV